MATTKSAMLMIKLSSSYVLIITTPSTGFSEWVGARPPATRVNTVFSFSPAHCGAGRDFVHRLYNRLLLPLTAFSTFFTSNVCPVSPNSKEYIV